MYKIIYLIFLFNSKSYMPSQAKGHVEFNMHRSFYCTISVLVSITPPVEDTRRTLYCPAVRFWRFRVWVVADISMAELYTCKPELLITTMLAADTLLAKL